MTDAGETRPTPVQAIENKPIAFSARPVERRDRFSQLVDVDELIELATQSSQE
jgi:hypothetical protein